MCPRLRQLAQSYAVLRTGARDGWSSMPPTRWRSEWQPRVYPPRRMNVILLGGYTLGCHSLRHLVGGMLDQPSRAPVRKTAYDCASCLNRGHMRWAWFSLFGVAFADLYVRMCAMGIWTDLRLL